MTSKRRENANLTSSVTEYLTYIAATGNSSNSVEMRYENENIWLIQRMMSELYMEMLEQLTNILRKFTPTKS